MVFKLNHDGEYLLKSGGKSHFIKFTQNGYKPSNTNLVGPPTPTPTPTPTSITPGTTILTDSSIKGAINMWKSSRSSAISTYGYIKQWDVSAVKNMLNLFKNDSTFNEDINGWDVSSVTNMDGMFHGAKAFNQPLAGWDVSKVTNMNNLFNSATAFHNNKYNWRAGISHWKPKSSVTTNAMFGGVVSSPLVQYANQAGVKQSSVQPSYIDLQGTVTLKGTSGNSGCFYTTKFDNSTISSAVNVWVASSTNALSTYGHIEYWDVSAVVNMQNLFKHIPSAIRGGRNTQSTFNDDISKWDVSSVTNMNSMFFDAIAFNRSLGSWNVSNVTDMSFMFKQANKFNQLLGSWNVSNVTTMVSMFDGATAFMANDANYYSTTKNDGISKWKPTKITASTFTTGMFQGIISTLSPSSPPLTWADLDGSLVISGNVTDAGLVQPQGTNQSTGMFYKP
jgi:surface protein